MHIDLTFFVLAALLGTTLTVWLVTAFLLNQSIGLIRQPGDSPDPAGVHLARTVRVAIALAGVLALGAVAWQFYPRGEAAGGDAGARGEADKTEPSGGKAPVLLASQPVAPEAARITRLTGAEDLQAGEALFARNCVACHGAKGEGMVGPNLTDHYWIHGDGIADIYRVVHDGVPEKGMAAWGGQLSEKEVQQVASYVATLREAGTVKGKDPQGSLFLPAAGEWIYLTNEDAGALSIIAGDTYKVVATIPVGRRPRGVRVSPDGRRVFVALSGSPKCPPTMSDEECESRPVDKSKDGIAEIDVASRKLVRILPGGSDPEQFDVSPDGTRLFVANEDAATASIVDLQSGKVAQTVAVSREPEGVKAGPDGTFFYVTGESDHDITVVDAKSGAVLKKIPVGKRPRDIIFSRNGKRAYVSGEADGTVTVIDPARHEAIATVKLPVGAKPMGLALSRDDARLYVANGRAGTLSEIDLVSGKVARTVKAGKRPWGLVVSGDGQRLYAANGPSNTVSVVNTETFSVVDSVAVGESPWGAAVGPNPRLFADAPAGKPAKEAAPAVSAQVVLAAMREAGNVQKGQVLFNATLGCAHCHGTNAKGHTDNRNLRYIVRRYGKDSEKVITKVLNEGRSGTAMPPWKHLSKKQLADIKAFVASLQED